MDEVSQQLAPQPEQPTTSSPTPDVSAINQKYYRHSGYLTRLGAAIVDGIVILMITIPVTFILGNC